jgi:hypothetical protein
VGGGWGEGGGEQTRDLKWAPNGAQNGALKMAPIWGPTVGAYIGPKLGLRWVLQDCEQSMAIRSHFGSNGSIYGHASVLVRRELMFEFRTGLVEFATR